MSKKVVVFGGGNCADQAYYYLTNDSPYEVVAFTVDGAYLNKNESYGLPVIAFEKVVSEYPPSDFKMFVAVGYQNLNRFRAQKYQEAKSMGYELISYVSSRASNFGDVAIGDNCFILENSVIQPCSQIGSNIFLGCGCHIGHHAKVDDHCYLAGQVVVSGVTTVEPYCYLGVNATLGHEITVGTESFIGASVLLTKSVAARSVYITPDTPKYRLDSPAFLRLTKMK
jgi:sugar O-acyltransferase (sialic acid O-acetyltransferase NeuD family)